MQSVTKWSVLIAVSFLILAPVKGQDYLLSKKIKLSGTDLKTSRVLDEMSTATGLIFTYDTKIIDPDKRIGLGAASTEIRTILDSISSVQLVRYSVIGKHIMY